MTEKMQRLDLCSPHFRTSSKYKAVGMVVRCEDCKYYKACDDNEACKGCPMHYGSRFSTHHCHCCAYVTRDELKQKKCKFFVQKEDN